MKRWLVGLLLARAVGADTPVVQGMDYPQGLAAGRYVVTGPSNGYQGLIRVLDPQTGRYIADWSVSGTLSGCAADPKGRWLAVQLSGVQEEIRVYSLENGRQLARRLFDGGWMAGCPDGRHLAVLKDFRVTVLDNSLRTVASWKVGPAGRGGIEFLDEHRLVAGTEVYDLRGKRLGTRAGSLSQHADTSNDRRFRVERGDGETPLTVYEGKRPVVEVLGASNHCFSPDSRQVVIPNRNLDLYSLPDGKLLRRFEGLRCDAVEFVGPWLLGRDQDDHGFLADPRSGEVRPLGKRNWPGSWSFLTADLLGLADGSGLQLFDWRRGSAVASVPDFHMLPGGKSRDEKVALGFSGRDFRCVSLPDGRELWRCPIPAKGWKDDEMAGWGKASWSADGSRVLAHVEINQPLSAVLQASDGKLVRRFSDDFEALSADGQRVANGQEVSLSDGKKRKLPVNSGYIQASYSPQGDWLALHGTQGFTLLHRGQLVLQKAFVKPVDPAAGVWSADGRWLGLACPASGRNGGGTAHLVDLRSLRAIPLLRPDPVSALAFSRDSRWLISGGNSQQYAGLWDLSGPRLVRQFRPQAGDWEGFESQFSPDGRVLMFHIRDQTEFYARESGRHLGSMYVFGKEWLVTTPSGAYDGTPGGIEHLCIRGATLQDVKPASERRELQKSGLLARILSIDG